MRRITEEQFKQMQAGTAGRKPPAPKKKPVEHEEPEQIAFITWMKSALPDLFPDTFHPANGGKRHPKTANRMKALGVKPGVPDLFIERPKYDPETGRVYFGMRAEFKATPPHNSSPSPDQRDWLARLEKRGYYAVLTKGISELKRQVTWYANLPDLEPGQCQITS